VKGVGDKPCSLRHCFGWQPSGQKIPILPLDLFAN
jgi:hypothetical protein